MPRMLRDKPVRIIAQPVRLSVGMVVAGWRWPATWPGWWSSHWLRAYRTR